MSSGAALPPPPAVVQVKGFASDFDKAERASSSLQSSLTASTLCTERDIPRCRIKATSKRSSRVKKLWSKHRASKLEKNELYSAFKCSKVKDYPEGYPQLAAFLNSADNFAILRRFGTTNARVLLHLQTEISFLEHELAELDQSDAKDVSGQFRLRSREHEDGWDEKQLEIMKALEKRLGVYYDLLLKDTQMRALGKPMRRNCQNVLHWIIGNKPVVKGEDDWILRADDLVPLANVDRFESSIASSFLHALFTTSDQENGIIQLSQFRIAFTVKLLSFLLAIFILITPILVLFLADLSKIWMSATLVVSVLTFSATLCFFSKISAQELLVGSAAYCAVLSAFLGNLNIQPAGNSR